MKLDYYAPLRLYYELRWLLGGKRFRNTEAAIRGDFDPEFYLRTYPVVRRIGVPPIRHFIIEGDRRGYDPNPMFSTKRYRQSYEDVRHSKMNALQHFVKHGRPENRVGHVSDRTGITVVRPAPKLKPPAPPSVSVFAGMAPRVVDGVAPGTVDVVIPVYKGLAHTAACLRSVMSARVATPFEVVVVDDASPEPEVTRFLAEVARLGLVRLLVNEGNLGFVRSVNRGMALHPERDVVLLNNDAVVFDGWLDRIVARGAAGADVATVTPFSNNATICSYPVTAADNPHELELPSAELDGLAATVNRAVPSVEVPTGVGYCMWIRRAVLDAIGDFDAEAFGRGYGEENDFCMRALKAGYRNVLAPDAFVLHYGSVSFGKSQSPRIADALKVLARRHPDYAIRVKSHIAADPALAARIRLDAARLARAIGLAAEDGETPAFRTGIVFLTHTWGGGIETYLDRIRDALLAAGRKDLVDASLVMRCHRQGLLMFDPFGDVTLPNLPNLATLNIERHREIVGEILAILKPTIVHVNSLAGLNLGQIDILTRAIAASGAPVWHVWHDHQPLTPRVDFLDAEGRMVDELDEAREDVEAAVSGEPLEWARVAEWRGTFRRYLATAERVVAPSEAAAERARRIAPPDRVVVEPHPEPDLMTVRPLGGRRGGRDKLRVAIVGAIGVHKGANLLAAMAIDIDERKLPIRFDLVGYSASRDLSKADCTVTHGRYEKEGEALAILRKVHPDVVLMSSVWPETYVFTLSLAFALGLPVVTFDLGAQAERVRAYGRGVVLDRRLIEDPVAVNDALLGIDVDALWARPADARFTKETSLATLWDERAAPAPVVEVRRDLVA